MRKIITILCVLFFGANFHASAEDSSPRDFRSLRSQLGVEKLKSLLPNIIWESFPGSNVVMFSINSINFGGELYTAQAFIDDKFVTKIVIHSTPKVQSENECEVHLSKAIKFLEEAEMQFVAESKPNVGLSIVKKLTEKSEVLFIKTNIEEFSSTNWHAKSLRNSKTADIKIASTYSFSDGANLCMISEEFSLYKE